MEKFSTLDYNMPGLPHPNFYYSTIYGNAAQPHYVETFTNPPQHTSYEHYATQDEHAFVMFYAPWCGHCKTAKPEMAQTMGGVGTEFDSYKSGQFKKHNGKTAVILVNCDEHPEIAKKFGVNSFPTFKYLKGIKDRQSLEADEVVEYTGGRSASDFEQYVNLE